MTTAPQRATALQRGLVENIGAGYSSERRIKPYPPNLRRSPARIIDPAIGASTWALGSHKWKIYKGNFTRNAIIDISHHNKKILLCNTGAVYILRKKVLWPFKLYISINLISRGRLAQIV